MYDTYNAEPTEEKGQVIVDCSNIADIARCLPVSILKNRQGS